MTIQQVQVSPIGARLIDSRTTIPELARVSLDRYSNNRFKQLKLVTKAFKYNFPFYEGIFQRKAFQKIFGIIESFLLRMIPYLGHSKVKFIDYIADVLTLRVGPNDNSELTFLMVRYCRYITHIARKYSVPVYITTRDATYIVPKIVDGRVEPYRTLEEERLNRYNVVELRCSLNTGEGYNGYFLLYYAEEVIKVLETLHRKAHYAEQATVRTRQAPVS
jgi:hypothetical protein